MKEQITSFSDLENVLEQCVNNGESIIYYGFAWGRSLTEGKHYERYSLKEFTDLIVLGEDFSILHIETGNEEIEWEQFKRKVGEEFGQNGFTKSWLNDQKDNDLESINHDLGTYYMYLIEISAIGIEVKKVRNINADNIAEYIPN